MATGSELAEKEKAFLSSMADVRDIGYSGGRELSERYKEKYGCDPCDACGPDACADCKACLENSVDEGSINPFDRSKGEK